MSAVFENVIELPVQNPLADLVEEFVALHNRISPDLDRYEKLKKRLAAEVAKDKSDMPVSLEGYEHIIDYTAPSQALDCLVSPQELIDATDSWGSLSVSITNARKFLTEAQLGELFETKLGARRFRRIR
jgi:hypothetical protein